MNRMIALTLVALTLPGLAAASSYERVPDEMQTRIRSVLEADGFTDIRKIERDDGYYEVYAMKDGQRFEIYLDATPAIIRTSRDD